MRFIATQFQVTDEKIVETNRKEIYLAENITDAVSHVLYTRRLSDRNAKLGPTGLVVYSRNFAWTIQKENEH